MTVRKTILAALAVLAVAALAGCAKPVAPADTSAKPSAPAASSTDAKVPTATIELVTPTDGASVAAGQLRVSVKTTNLKFVMPGNEIVPGEGHLHVTLDDEPFEMSIEPEYTFENVAPGEHRLKAELVNNDTSSLDPPVVQEITFTAE